MVSTRWSDQKSRVKSVRYRGAAGTDCGTASQRLALRRTSQLPSLTRFKSRPVFMGGAFGIAAKADIQYPCLRFSTLR